MKQQMKEEIAVPRLTLIILRETFAICRLDKDAPIPDWAFQRGLFSVTRTKDELSILSPQINVPKGIVCNRGWSCLKVKGPLDLSSIGIISLIAKTLEEERISLFSISTYDTDYILVKENDLEKAILALNETGQRIQWEQNE
jgi:hypothetical protein